MKLEVFDKDTRIRVGIINVFNFVKYSDEYCGIGSFEITIPTMVEDLSYLKIGNYIFFDTGVVGIIKGISDTEESDVEVKIYGYLVNHILQYRRLLRTTKYHGAVGTVARQLVTDSFINPTDVRRKIDFVSLSSDPAYIPTITSHVTVQSTGDMLFDILNDILYSKDLGFELYPVLETTNQGAMLVGLEFRIITPVYRTVGNVQNNIPVVFSFDLDNLQTLEYEEDARSYNSMVIVVCEDANEQRRTLEVGDTTLTGIDRIESYVDAGVIRADSSEEPLTTSEIEEIMEQRGLDDLKNHKIFLSVDGAILTGSMQYVYGIHFKKGDYVSVYSKKLNKMVNLQVTSVSKSISDGVEHFDIGFGDDRLTVTQLRS